MERYRKPERVTGERPQRSLGNGRLATNATASFGFNGSWNNSSNPAPTNFALNGVACTGRTSPSPTTSPTASPSPTTSPTGGPRPAHSMGFIGCSMAENTAQGYVADGGTRMWGPYGTGGLVVQSWTDPNSSAWQLFDQQVSRFGRPSAVWVQICMSESPAPNPPTTPFGSASEQRSSGHAATPRGRAASADG